MAELADVTDLKSVERNLVWVQVPLPACIRLSALIAIVNPG